MTEKSHGIQDPGIQELGPGSPELADKMFEFLDSVPAAFLTEIATKTGSTVKEVAALLAASRGRAVVVAHSAPDRHVTSDLQIAAVVKAGDELVAHDRVARYWRAWVREFMASHRCS